MQRPLFGLMPPEDVARVRQMEAWAAGCAGDWGTRTAGYITSGKVSLDFDDAGEGDARTAASFGGRALALRRLMHAAGIPLKGD